MTNVFQIIKKATRRHKIVRLHRLCCKGMSQKSVRGFESVSWLTWLELMGYYGVLANHQEIKPVLSKQAKTVLFRIGL